MQKHFDYIIPLGENCQTTINLRSMGLRMAAFPFDWHGIRSFEIAGNGGLAKKVDLICNNFVDFFVEENYEEFFEQWTTAHRLVFNKKTGLQFLHEFPKEQTIHEYFPTFIAKYKTRVKRLYDVLDSESSILFVFIEFFAHLSDKEITATYHKLAQSFPLARIDFLIVRNSSELSPWQIKEKELHERIHTFFINNDFKADYGRGKGNIGNKKLYRKIIYDMAIRNYVDVNLYNECQELRNEMKKSFDYLGWKVNEVIPQLLQDLRQQMPKRITYQNEWEKQFIKKRFSDFNISKYSADIQRLISGLDYASAVNVQKILYRMDSLLKSSYGNIDIFDEEEQKKILDTQKNVSRGIELDRNLFYNYGFYLPKNHFESCVFEEKLNLHLLPSSVMSKLKQTDFIDAGAYIGDSALILKGLFPKRIYAFEANKHNYELLVKTIKLNHLENVIPFESALGNINGEAYIDENDACSSIQTQQTPKICNMQTLDTFVDNEPDCTVGLIKVDIEGAEKLFLTGALETIKKFKPVLLFSIYHSWDDFLYIKTMLEKLNLGYIFKISKPAPGAIILETNLIAYIPGRDEEMHSNKRKII